MSKVVQCPECGRDLALSDQLVTAQLVRCNHCDADLEIVDAVTMELDWAYKAPVVWEGWRDLDVFLSARWEEFADWKGEEEVCDRNEWDTDIEDENRICDPLN